MSELKHAVWLSLKLPPATKAVDAVLSAFDNDYDAIYFADRDQYTEKLVEGEKDSYDELIDSLCDKELSEAERIIDFCERQNIGIVTLDSKLYPACLKRIPMKPVLLYFRGRFPDFDNNACIATVGTRRLTEYGRRNAYLISRDLARGGAIVVSGLARGIDSVCHRGALDAGGFTVAVLGCGIDVVYPSENEALMNEIAFKGTVITEFAPGTEPKGFNFPKRNRIISGLCSGTLVVEADEKSGAMITAKYAISQGRDIFALPGNVGEINSKGTNSLIMNGARMVTSALDILSEYEYIYPNSVRTDLIPGRSAPSVLLQRPRGSLKLASPSPDNEDIKNLQTAESVEPYKKKEKKKAEKKVPSKPKKEKSEKVELEDKPSAAKTPSQNSSPLSENEKAVLSAMPEGKGVTCDEIARSGLPISTVLITLTTLEIKKYVSALPGGLYVKH